MARNVIPRSSRCRAIKARFLERLVDRRAFDAIEIILQRPFVADRERRIVFLGWWRQVKIFRRDPLRVGGQRQSAFQNVLELANVAGNG